MARTGWECSVAVILLGVAVHAAEAQTLRGRLLDMATDRPIEGGRILLLTESGDSVAVTITDREGGFSLGSREPGSFLLNASALGYRATTGGVFELGVDGELSLDFRLEPDPLAVEGIVAEGAGPPREAALVQAGFYDRWERGFGHFIAPSEVEASTALRTSQLLYGVPGVAVLPTPLGGHVVAMRNARGRYCTPRIFVDGVALVTDHPRGFSLDGALPKVEVAAVEVYRRPGGAPLQYGGVQTGGCGVILFWTKR